MFKDYKYNVISITRITSFFRVLLLSASNVRMSEGTLCRVGVHIVRMMTPISYPIKSGKISFKRTESVLYLTLIPLPSFLHLFCFQER